jgi:flagella basal body P-ring formation protein FlgA
MPKSFLNLWIVSVAVLAGFDLPAQGANLLLRSRATHQGAVIYLGDVADISAANESELEDLRTTPLLAAPAPGTQQFLNAVKLRDMLSSRGIDVSTLSINGAKTIEIGEAPAHVDLPQAEPLPVLSPMESRQAVLKALEQYLTDSTGHEDWEVHVDLDAAQLRELTKLGSKLIASAQRTPGAGAQKFQITAEGAKAVVLIYVRVERMRHVVVAVRKIEAGSLIGAADVEMRRQGGNVASGSATSIDQVIGKESLRGISADTVLQANQLRSPLQVQRGETVKVFARTAGITVSTYAVVQQDGSLGDLVQAQTLDKKDRFAARVSGWKQLEVSPMGATAADFASLNKNQTEQR